MKKPISLLILFISFFSISHAQHDIKVREWNDSTYNAEKVFPAEGVADDYGPRGTAKQYFHLGIDYNSNYDDSSDDMWDMIMAPEDGTIVDVNRLCTNATNKRYKQLCYQAGTKRYIFGHVYDNASSKNFVKNDSTIVLKRMLSPHTDKWAQILIVDNDTLIYGQRIGSVEWMGDTLTTTTSVDEGDPIVPLGKSSTSGAHLHFNTIPLNKNHSTGSTYHNCNPLEFINYKDTTTTCEVYCKSNNSKFEFRYPGTDVSPIAAKVILNSSLKANGKRYFHIFNMDKVFFRVKNINIENDTGSIVKGPWRDGKIILGGKLGEDLLNHPKKKFEIDWWKYTGVAAHAYAGGTYKNHNYDIYHFSDWKTRIHKDDNKGKNNYKIADLPENARYQDGYYKLSVDRSTISDKINTLVQDSILLDNFVPYIREVEVDFDNRRIGVLVRKVDEKTLTKANDGIIDSKISNQASSTVAKADLKVTVKVSEPMDTLSMNIPKLNLTDISPSSISGLEYTFEKEDVELFDSTDLCLKLEFEGKDLAGNKLLNVSKKTNGNDGKTNISIPTRKSSGTSPSNWIPTLSDAGLDSLSICVGNCSGSGNLVPKNKSVYRGTPCLDLFLLEEIIENATCNQFDGSVSIEHPDLNNTFDITWTDQNGDNIPFYDGQFQIEDLAAGEYCYFICGSNCSFSGCLTVEESIPKVFVEFEVINDSSSEAPFAKIKLLDDNPDYEVIWRNSLHEILLSETVDSVSMSPYNLSLTDEYCFEIINNSGCIYTQCFIIDNNNCEGDSILSLDFENIPSCNNDGQIIVNVDNGKLPYNYIWSDGSTDKDRNGLLAGNYSLTITDDNGCSITGNTIVEDFEPIDLESMPVDILSSTCTGASGAISILWSPSGGNPPYQYFWSNGYDGKTNLGIPAGTYEVTVEDSKGCSNTKSYTVNGAGQPSLEVITSKGTCFGHTTGEINIGLSAEIGPLTYSIPSGVNYTVLAEGIIQLTDLAIGDYCITVTDSGNSCFTEVCESIGEVSNYIDLTVNSSTSIQNSCDSEPNGSIFVNASGGVGDIYYSWSDDPSASSHLRSNLLPGVYTVTVSDECDNEIVKSYEVESETTDINVEAVVSCVSAITKVGKIDLTVTGSNGPYSFYWSNFTYDQDLIVDNSGLYTVKIVDINGCSIEKTYQVNDTDDDLEASVLLSDLSNCEDTMEVLASVVVQGGDPPYSFSWWSGGEESTTTFSYPGDFLPTPINYSVTVTDQCNNKVVIQSSVNCEELCNDDCIVLFKTGDPTCVDVCGDSGLGIFELGCDKLKVRSFCDDGVSRTFFWAGLTSSSGEETEFIGDEIVSGIEQINVVNEGPGYANAIVKNNLTGCVKWISLFIPSKCFSLWNWVWDCDHCGDFGDGIGDLPSDEEPECLDWEVINDIDNCEIIWKCVDPPNTFPDQIDVIDEFCYYDLGNDLGLIYSSCDCNILGGAGGSPLILDENITSQFCECNSPPGIANPFDTTFVNIKCQTNPIDVLYDKEQNKFVYVTSEYNLDSIFIPYVTTNNIIIDTSYSFSSFTFETSLYQAMTIDEDRNLVITTLDEYDQINVTKYDTLGATIWHHKLTQANILKVITRVYKKAQTEIITVLSTGYEIMIVDDFGNIVSTTTVSNNRQTLFSEIDSTILSIEFNGPIQILNFQSSSSNFTTSISSEIKIVKYFKDINHNIVLFYNYKSPFSINGENITLEDKSSSGILVLSSSGQIINNYVLPFTKNMMITDVDMGIKNKFALIGYFSNNTIVNCTNLFNNDELCSFIIAFDLTYDVQGGLRKNDIEEHKTDILVYPNPTSSNQIEILSNSENIEKGSLLLYDNNNKLIYRKEDVQLSNKIPYLFNLGENAIPGVYILKFQGTNTIVSKKVIFIK
ncbi:MAG: T9SS type A sorting domain-containing protein [Bacteroidota bacterium]